MKPWAFLAALLIPMLSFAQLTQTIRGTVIDKDSKSPLIGANIILLNSDPFKGTISDVDGNFRLEEVPLGRHSLKISFLGYKEVILPEIEVNSVKEIVLTIEMEEKVLEAEATVTARKRKDETNNEMAVVSSRTFSVEETNKYAGSWGDPARMASNFAGVTGWKQ
jgi:hypothetical protein